MQDNGYNYSYDEFMALVADYGMKSQRYVRNGEKREDLDSMTLAYRKLCEICVRSRFTGPHFYPNENNS